MNIKRNETIEGIAHVEGTFEGKPYVMVYSPDEASGTIKGDFDDTERLQILTVWEMRK